MADHQLSTITMLSSFIGIKIISNTSNPQPKPQPQQPDQPDQIQKTKDSSEI